MTADFTIQEGSIESEKNTKITLWHTEGEWIVCFRDDHEEWEPRSPTDLREWLLQKLEPPMTVSEAESDDVVSVASGDLKMAYDEDVARASFDPDNKQWTVEILIE